VGSPRFRPGRSAAVLETYLRQAAGSEGSAAGRLAERFPNGKLTEPTAARRRPRPLHDVGSRRPPGDTRSSLRRGEMVRSSEAQNRRALGHNPPIPIAAGRHYLTVQDQQARAVLCPWRGAAGRRRFFPSAPPRKAPRRPPQATPTSVESAFCSGDQQHSLERSGWSRLILYGHGPRSSTSSAARPLHRGHAASSAGPCPGCFLKAFESAIPSGRSGPAGPRTMIEAAEARRRLKPGGNHVPRRRPAITGPSASLGRGARAIRQPLLVVAGTRWRARRCCTPRPMGAGGRQPPHDVARAMRRGNSRGEK